MKENNTKILATIEESLKAKKIFDENLMKSFHDIGTSSNNVNKELVAHKTSIHDILRSQASDIQLSTDDFDRSLKIVLQNQAAAKIQNKLTKAQIDSIHERCKPRKLSSMRTSMYRMTRTNL